jgi:hypothetical protein
MHVCPLTGGTSKDGSHSAFQEQSTGPPPSHPPTHPPTHHPPTHPPTHPPAQHADQGGGLDGSQRAKHAPRPRLRQRPRHLSAVGQCLPAMVEGSGIEAAGGWGKEFQRRNVVGLAAHDLWV